MKLTVKRAAAALALAAALPVAAASSASAATSSGCTVTPQTPTYSYTATNGVKVLRYDITVTCNGGRTANIYQEVWEEDTFSDDHISSTTTSRTFSTYGTQTVSLYRYLPDTELGMEEMYQKVRFTVSSNGVTSPVTGWERSGVRAFYN